MGVDKPSYKSQVPDYVLSRFDEKERVCLQPWVDSAADAIKMLAKHPLDMVRNRYTRKSIEAICP
jgi:peptidyl-tRNA hydrolase